MRLARTMLTVLVGLSVALLPAGVGFSAGAPQAAAATAAMSASAMHDCDHHIHAPGGDTQKSDSNCISLNGCVCHCFSFSGIASAEVAYAPASGTAFQPMRRSDHLSSQTGSLPFRPPRV